MLKGGHVILKNQSGAALVVALLMIVILSLIGIASSSNSTFEIRLSGNKRAATDAFFTADAGMRAIMADTNNFICTDTNTAGVPTEILTEGFAGKKTSSFTFSLPAGSSFTDQPTVSVFQTTQQKVPRGIGISAIAFKYNYYIIDSIGRDQMDLGSTKSNCEIRQKIVRLIPTGN